MKQIEITSFIFKQIDHLIEGGWKTLINKVKILVDILINKIKPLKYLTFLPFIIMIRLISPIIIIRCGPLFSDRIGHFSANTEIYYIEKFILNKISNYKDIFFTRIPISNNQLLRMWKRNIQIETIAKYLYHCNRLIPGGNKHSISLVNYGDRDTNGLLSKYPNSIYFTKSEELTGEVYLKRKGLISNQKFVCFHNREDLYIKKLDAIAYRNNPKSKGSNKHDYRNSNINNSVDAIKMLSSKKYYIFRMGVLSKNKLNVINSNIVDYANNGDRTEFLDIYLSSKCRFMVSDPSGIEATAMIFRKPIVHINMIPIEYASTYVNNCLFIPKLLWMKKTKSLMKFKDIYESGIGQFYHTKLYDNYGIEVIENSNDEIHDVVYEMESRLNGSWMDDDYSISLQNKFWNDFPQSDLHGKIKARIGSAFLKKYNYLL